MTAVDTNILIHAHRRDSTLHEEAEVAVRKLAESPAPWFICYHSLVEFYGVATHRKIWASPSSPREAADQIEAWSESPSLTILADSGGGLAHLLALAESSKVVGPMIHDARIASTCLHNGITQLWTIDRDFSRFPALRTTNPLV